MTEETSQKTTVLTLSFLHKVIVHAALIRKDQDSFQLRFCEVARNGLKNIITNVLGEQNCPYINVLDEQNCIFINVLDEQNCTFFNMFGEQYCILINVLAEQNCTFLSICTSGLFSEFTRTAGGGEAPDRSSVAATLPSNSRKPELSATTTQDHTVSLRMPL
jgi:hypothetical protein